MSESRRSFLKTSAAAAVGGLLGACGPRAGETRCPNVLFAFADDQSYPHASALGDPVARTPFFDRVAREGVLFNNSFATCPSCAPSRSSVLTGRHAWQVQQGGVLYGTIPSEYPVFTHLLEDSGYHVGYTGKGWGPGNWQAGGLERYPIGMEYNDRLFTEPIAGGLDTRDYAANFDDFLADRSADAPFFFWFGCTEPHRAYERGVGLRSGKRLEEVRVPVYWPDTDEIRSDLLDYYYEVEWFDAQLGRLLQRLEQAGELDNTIVVVTSDNGMPFPRAKVNLYDGGVRMPLAVRWGQGIPAGRSIDDFVSHTDFAPTFLEAAGITPPDSVSGRSLLPMLSSSDSGTVEQDRDFAVTALERHTWCRPDGATYPIRALRTKDFLYLRNFEPVRWPTGGPDFISSNKTPHGDVDACPTKSFMLEPGNRKRFANEFNLCFGKRPSEELYDLRKDPDQVVNVASDTAYDTMRRQMWARLERHLTETGDPRILGEDPWRQYVYHQTVGFGATFNRSLSEEERRQARERDSHKPE